MVRDWGSWAAQLFASEFTIPIHPVLLAVALIATAVAWLTKIVLPKAVDSAIGHAFDRKLEEYKLELDSAFELYKDDLFRASVARALILDREVRYFDEVDKILAELIPLMHDMADSVSAHRFAKRDKKVLLRYLELIPELKNVLLVYEPYIDRCVWLSMRDLVVRLQDDIAGWSDACKKLSSRTIDEEDVEWSQKTRDEVLRRIAEARVRELLRAAQLHCRRVGVAVFLKLRLEFEELVASVSRQFEHGLRLRFCFYGLESRSAQRAVARSHRCFVSRPVAAGAKGK